MSRYLVVYKLENPETDFEAFKNEVNKNASWARPIPNCWMIDTRKSATGLRNELANSVDNRLKIFVVNIDNNPWASYDIPKEVTDWLKDK